MFEVVYFSKTGHTRKIASAIAGELGTKAEDVKTKKGLAKNSFVFLGSGAYGGMPGPALIGFVNKNDFKGRKVAVFGTSASDKGTEVEIIEKALKSKGAIIKGKFRCTGSFLFFMRMGHPNKEDIANAKSFADEMKKEVKK